MYICFFKIEKNFFKTPKFFISLTNILILRTTRLLSSVPRRAMTRPAVLPAPIPKKPIAAALPQRQSAFIAHPKPCLLFVYKMLQTASPSFAEVYSASKKDTLSGVFSLWWRRPVTSLFCGKNQMGSASIEVATAIVNIVFTEKSAFFAGFSLRLSGHLPILPLSDYQP